jgi:RNA polymerase sigma-70 factor (ECF subfamily)
MVDDPETGAQARRIYEEAMARAVILASRRLPSEQAFELAHDVASQLVQAGATGPDHPRDGHTFDALIRRAVSFRLRDRWRAGTRRTAAEQFHGEERGSTTPAWAAPDAVVEARELSDMVDVAIADMTPVMRDVFLAIRRDELSYKQAAARLGIAVGTVHAHLSRANARLRQAFEDYHNDQRFRDVRRS